MPTPKRNSQESDDVMFYAPGIDDAEDASRAVLAKYFSSTAPFSQYEKDMQTLQKTLPPETWNELTRRSAVSMRKINNTLNTGMGHYSQDAWSRAGLKALMTLPKYVPVGFGMGNTTLPQAGLAAVERGVDGKHQRAYFTGAIANKGFKDLPAVLRHEANHLVGAKDGEDVEYMDSFYGHRPIAPPSFAILGKMLEKASPYAKKDYESLKYAGPRSLQTDRSITPEDIAKAGLTPQEYLQLIDAAHTLDEVTGNQIKRTLPGDTLWGDFIRNVQNVVGEGEITNAMKAWTETPDYQRKWYRK